jgi:hypothetical protein
VTRQPDPATPVKIQPVPVTPPQPTKPAVLAEVRVKAQILYEYNHQVVYLPEVTLEAGGQEFVVPRKNFVKVKPGVYRLTISAEDCETKTIDRYEIPGNAEEFILRESVKRKVK